LSVSQILSNFSHIKIQIVNERQKERKGEQVAFFGVGYARSNVADVQVANVCEEVLEFIESSLREKKENRVKIIQIVVEKLKQVKVKIVEIDSIENVWQYNLDSYHESSPECRWNVSPQLIV
jgi:hypothetical protein